MIYVLRHGDLGDSVKGRYLGQADVPLSDRGFMQAEARAAFFRKENITFKKIFSSDLSRCMETARVIAGMQEIHPVPGLRETNLGLWELQKKEDIKRDFPQEWESYGSDPFFRPPNGETLAEFSARVLKVFTSIAMEQGPVLAVTHAGVIRCLIADIKNIPLTQIFTVKPDYSGLTVIDSSSAPMKITAENIPLS